MSSWRFLFLKVLIVALFVGAFEIVASPVISRVGLFKSEESFASRGVLTDRLDSELPQSVLIPSLVAGDLKKFTDTENNTTNFQGGVVPEAPINLNAIVGDGKIDLSWGSPGDYGDYPITGYIITWYSDLESVTRAVSGRIETASPEPFYKMLGLSNGVTYTLSVSAVNAIGGGLVSKMISAKPIGLPSAPTGLTGELSGKYLTINWQKSLDNGGSEVIGYQLEQRIGDSGLWELLVPNTGSTDRKYVIVSPVEGFVYQYRVSAINTAGMGPSSKEWTWTSSIASETSTSTIASETSTSTIASETSTSSIASMTSPPLPVPCTTTVVITATTYSVPEPVRDRRFPLPPRYVC